MADRRTSGYSLIETLVALTLVTFSALALMGVAWQIPLMMERSEAKRLSLRSLESTLELVRSGAIAPISGVIPSAPGTSALRLRSGIPLSITVRLAAAPSAVPGVTDVTLTATYRLRGRGADSSLTSKIWSLSASAP